MTARGAAADIPDGESVRWRALEVAAFSEHRGVLAALDPKGRHHSARVSIGGAAALVGMLLLLVLIVAPIVAFAIVLIDAFARPPAPEASIPTASIILLCTLPLLVVVLVARLRSDRARDALREVQAFLLGGFGMLTFVVILVRSSTQDFPDGVRWSAGALVPSLLAAIFYIALVRDAVRIQRGRDPNEPEKAERTGRTPAVEPLRHVRLAVERLSSEERERVRADLHAAIGDLESRGAIDAPTAERAREAELGKLALRMSQGSTPR